MAGGYLRPFVILDPITGQRNRNSHLTALPFVLLFLPINAASISEFSPLSLVFLFLSLFSRDSNLVDTSTRV